MKKVFFLVAVLMLPTVLAEQFPVQNVNSGFIGWLEVKTHDWMILGFHIRQFLMGKKFRWLKTGHSQS